MLYTIFLQFDIYYLHKFAPECSSKPDQIGNLRQVNASMPYDKPFFSSFSTPSNNNFFPPPSLEKFFQMPRLHVVCSVDSWLKEVITNNTTTFTV